MVIPTQLKENVGNAVMSDINKICITALLCALILGIAISRIDLDVIIKSPEVIVEAEKD